MAPVGAAFVMSMRASEEWHRALAATWSQAAGQSLSWCRHQSGRARAAWAGPAVQSCEFATATMSSAVSSRSKRYFSAWLRRIAVRSSVASRRGNAVSGVVHAGLAASVIAVKKVGKRAERVSVVWREHRRARARGLVHGNRVLPAFGDGY
jgi:hypothetical protein